MTMHKTKSFLRAVALLCLMALVLTLAPGPRAFAEEAASSAAAEEDTGETAREKYERLQGELEQISAEIDRVQDDKAAAEEYLVSLQAEQQVILSMIQINQQEIDATQAKLDEKQKDVAKVRAELYNNDLLYQKRLVAIYEMNNASVLSQVLSVESFTDFFQIIDAMQRISQNDTELLSQQSQRKVELQAQEDAIATDIAALNLVHEELSANNAALENNQTAQQGLIEQAVVQEEALTEQHEATYAEWEQAQREMIAEQQRVASTGSQQGDGSEYVGGVFVWPVPGFYTITCYFGAPDPNGSPHRGMDISGGGVNGAPIVACGNGTVTTASSHSSYGNYVVIDHGNGVKTLYAHCSGLNVGVGQTVLTGDTIAFVGSTGFSTGPHLHLEVQTGNGLEDPRNWLR